MLALSNKKFTFVLVSGCFGCCSIIILPKYYLKIFFFTEKAPYTTIITIFKAELCCDNEWFYCALAPHNLVTFGFVTFVIFFMPVFPMVLLNNFSCKNIGQTLILIDRTWLTRIQKSA